MWKFFLTIFKKLYQKRTVHSKINGEIRIIKYPRSYEICCGGCFQSSAYMNQMWRKALKKIPKTKKSRKFLMLGLGGGGGVLEIWKFDRTAEITAIEYDPEMISIAKSTYLKKIQNDSLCIVQEDVFEFVKDCRQKFDVIIFDLFCGKNIASVVQSDIFLENLKKILNKDGYLLVNYFADKKKSQPSLGKYFSQHCDFSYLSNKLAVYRHFGWGKAGDPLPFGYKNKEQSLNYQNTRIAFLKIIKLADAGGIYGISSNLKLFEYECYVCEQEPKITKSVRPKIVFWQPTVGQKKYPGWYTNYFKFSDFQHGIVVLNNVDYWQEWSPHAQRHRKKFDKDSDCEIIEIGLDEFCEAYRKCGQPDYVTCRMFIRSLKIVGKYDFLNLHLFAARDKKDSNIFAGLATVGHPDILSSRHYISFIDKNSIHGSAGYGMIDRWHKDCLNRGFKFLDLGIIWKKGDPKSWQGYSNFKKQFNPYIICYPQSLFRIVM